MASAVGLGAAGTANDSGFLGAAALSSRAAVCEPVLAWQGVNILTRFSVFKKVFCGQENAAQ